MMKKQYPFSKLIKQGREINEYTQKETANFLGLDTAQIISNAERGEARLSPRHFKKLSKFLKIDLSLLIDTYIADVREEVICECK